MRIHIVFWYQTAEFGLPQAWLQPRIQAATSINLECSFSPGGNAVTGKSKSSECGATDIAKDDHEDIYLASPASPSPSPSEVHVKCDRLGDEWVEG